MKIEKITCICGKAFETERSYAGHTSSCGKPKKKCLICLKEMAACQLIRHTKTHSKKKKDKFCLDCGKILEKKSQKKFCDSLCLHAFYKREKLSKWLSGEHSGANKGENQITSSWIKPWLIQQRGHKCEICEQTEWMGKLIPLVLDHINGDSANNRPENLRLVCGNCDMQLPTYKSKNWGNGRFARRVRFAQGKSS